MAAKSAALLFSYMYSSLAAPYLLTCLGQFLRMLLRYSDHLNHLVNYSYWYWWRQLQRARMITRVLFIIQHTLRSCKLLLLFTAMLVLLSLWARSRHEARQLYFEKFYFGSTCFWLTYVPGTEAGGHDTTYTFSSAALDSYAAFRTELYISTCELADVFDSDVVC